MASGVVIMRMILIGSHFFGPLGTLSQAIHYDNFESIVILAMHNLFFSQHLICREREHKNFKKITAPVRLELTTFR